MIPSPRDYVTALLVWPLEMSGQLQIVFRKSHGGPWGHEVLVPIGNTQVVFRIEDIDLFRHSYGIYADLSESYGSSGCGDHKHSATFAEDFIVNINTYDGVGSHGSCPVFKFPQCLGSG